MKTDELIEEMVATMAHTRREQYVVRELLRSLVRVALAENRSYLGGLQDVFCQDDTSRQLVQVH
jgi:hypothetical protein